MILVDSNIPMYLVGSNHPNKVRAQRLLEDLITEERRLVTDAEVLEEILHRYAALGRLDAIQPAFDAVLDLVDDVYPVRLEEAETAKRIVLGAYGLSARDAVHVAVMQAHGFQHILSFDAGFDRFPGIERIT